MGIGAQGVVVVAVEVGPDDAAVLGGPVGVDVLGRHDIHAELLHSGADWLGAESADAQARHIVLLHIGQILRVGHDAFEEGDAGLEDLHAVALDDAGEAAGAGEDRRALDQDAGAAAGERGAEHVALPGDPAGVGHHEDHVAGLSVEAHLHGMGEAGGVAAVNMDYALGLAGAARGVDDKQRELGVQRRAWRQAKEQPNKLGAGESEQLGVAAGAEATGGGGGVELGLGGGEQLVAPAVALGAEDDLLASVAHHNHSVYAGRRGDERLGDTGAHLRLRGGVELAQGGERRAHTAHRVGAIRGDVVFGRVGDVGQHGGALLGAEAGHGREGLLDEGAHRLHGDVAIKRVVGVELFVGHHLGVAIAAVGGDDHAGAGVVDAVGERFVGEAAEDGGVDDAKALGGLGVVDLGENVGHIEGDTIALLEPESGEHQGGLHGLQQQLRAGKRLVDDRAAATGVERAIPAVALEEIGDLVAVAGEDVAINLVEAGVGGAALEPAIERRVIGIQGAGPGLVIGAVRRLHRRAAAGVEARPAGGRLVPDDPGAAGGIVPVDRAAGDGAVEGAGVVRDSAALGFPIVAGANGVAARRAGRGEVRGFDHR